MYLVTINLYAVHVTSVNLNM